MTEGVTLPSVVVVTGTSTGVGKTVATAALAVALSRRGSSVVVVKPLQTGVAPAEDGDAQEVRRLVGPDPRVEVRELVRLRDPLAPDTAARREGVPLPSVADHAGVIADLARSADVVLVEGAGGLLVRLDEAGATLADLGIALRDAGTGVGYLLVVAPGLGTLNHTALTAEALASRGLPLLGVVVGSYPAHPGLAEQTNLDDLPIVANAPLVGCLPDGAGALGAEEFTSQAPGWLTC